HQLFIQHILSEQDFPIPTGKTLEIEVRGCQTDRPFFKGSHLAGGNPDIAPSSMSQQRREPWIGLLSRSCLWIHPHNNILESSEFFLVRIQQRFAYQLTKDE